MDSLITTKTPKGNETIPKLRSGLYFLFKLPVSFYFFLTIAFIFTTAAVVFVDAKLQIIELSYQLFQNEREVHHIKLDNNDKFSSIASIHLYDQLKEKDAVIARIEDDKSFQ